MVESIAPVWCRPEHVDAEVRDRNETDRRIDLQTEAARRTSLPATGEYLVEAEWNRLIAFTAEHAGHCLGAVGVGLLVKIPDERPRGDGREVEVDVHRTRTVQPECLCPGPGRGRDGKSDA